MCGDKIYAHYAEITQITFNTSRSNENGRKNHRY
jgi:hypothetical protein